MKKSRAKQASASNGSEVVVAPALGVSSGATAVCKKRVADLPPLTKPRALQALVPWLSP